MRNMILIFAYLLFAIGFFMFLKLGFFEYFFQGLKQGSINTPFNSTINVTKEVQSIVKDDYFMLDLKKSIVTDRTFSVHIIKTYDSNRVGGYNHIVNTLYLFEDYKLFGNLENKENLKKYLESKEEVIRHEMIHYFLKKDEKLKEEIFQEVYKILQEEMYANLSVRRNIMSVYRTYLMKNYLKDKYTLEYVLSEEGKSKREIRSNFYEELVTHYFMKEEHKNRYPEISKRLFE